MSREARIPPSPSADDYARQLDANGDEAEVLWVQGTDREKPAKRPSAE